MLHTKYYIKASEVFKVDFLVYFIAIFKPDIIKVLCKARKMRGKGK